MSRIQTVTIPRENMKSATYEQYVIEDGEYVLAQFKLCEWQYHTSGCVHAKFRRTA